MGRGGYQEKMERQFRELSRRIDGLLERAERQARGEYRRQVEALPERAQVVREKLTRLKESGEEAWGELKPGLERAWEELRKSVEAAADRFR